MQLTIHSSVSLMYWLVLQWDISICKLKSFRLICLNPYFIFIFYFNYILPHQIYNLQGMQLTTNSSTALMCWLVYGWDCRICELNSFRLICWTMLFDQDCVTHLKSRCWFINSLYATTLCSPGLPLQCFLDIKEPLQHLQNISNRFLAFER